MKIKMILAAMLLCGAAFSGSGCAWLQSIETVNTVTTVQSYEQQVQIVLNLSEAAFSVVLPFLPEADQKAYEAAVATANDAITALNDAVQVAQAAGQTNINVATLEQTVATTVGALVALVNQFVADANAMNDAGATADAGTRAHAPVAVMELNRALSTMKRVGHVK